MRRLVILGGGESGVGTAALAKKHNWDVFLSDNGTLADNYREKLAGSGVEFEEGGHTEQKILTAGEVGKRPGIPATAPIVRELLMQCNP